MDKKRECKYSEVLDVIHGKVKTNRDYWLFTEVFCLVHNNKDYCNCTEKLSKQTEAILLETTKEIEMNGKNKEIAFLKDLAAILKKHNTYFDLECELIGDIGVRADLVLNSDKSYVSAGCALLNIGYFRDSSTSITSDSIEKLILELGDKK